MIRDNQQAQEHNSHLHDKIMLSKKILIDGAEAYLQLNKNPEGEVSIFWIIDSVLRENRLARINHDFISNGMVYEYLFKASEITDLGSFDYSAADPDYSLIEAKQISVTRFTSSLMIPALSFRNPVPLSPISAVSIFAFNSMFFKHFEKEGQEDIVDWGTLTLRQPFYFDTMQADESAEGANDGEIHFENSWGGDASLEYSIDDGATWNASPDFVGLAPGSYELIVKDGAANESFARTIEIKEFEEIGI